MSFGVLLILVLIGWILSGITSAGGDSESDKRDVERAKGAAWMLFGGLGFGLLIVVIVLVAILSAA